MMTTDSNSEQWQKLHDRCLARAMECLELIGQEHIARELVITAGIAVDKMVLLRKAQ